jgi:hypothetical protein
MTAAAAAHPRGSLFVVVVAVFAVVVEPPALSVVGWLPAAVAVAPPV